MRRSRRCGGVMVQEDLLRYNQIHMLDLSCLPPNLRDAQVQRLALHAITQPFDLEHGPLLRAALLRLALRPSRA